MLTDTTPRHAKIADFGLAKAVDSGTFLKTFCGTPTYLAPEVVLRAQDAGYNELVDSWSLGVIVWSMLTNTVPFTEDDEDMVTKFQRRQVEWSQVSGFGLSAECIDWMKGMLVPNPAHRMSLVQALAHPWLAELANSSEVERPAPRQRTLTPTDAGGSTATNSSATASFTASLVSSEPPTSQELREIDRFSQDMSSMVLDHIGVETNSALGSASLVSGAVSVVSGVTATTHTSDASNLRLVSKFSEDSDASLPIPGRFPHSPGPQNMQGALRAQPNPQPHPLRNAQLPQLQNYETPQMQHFGNQQVPNAPVRGGQAPPIADDSMQTDSSWDQVSRGAESTMHPQLQAEFTPNPLSPHGIFASPHTPAHLAGLGQFGVGQPGTPNGQYPQPVNGQYIQPPHLQYNQSPQTVRTAHAQAFSPPAAPTAPYQFRTRGAAASPLRPQQPRERVIPAHPGPMREPLPAPSSPIGSTPTTTTASTGKRTGLELEESGSDLSDADEEDDLPRGPTGTVRQKRPTGLAPTRVSSRVRARRAGAAPVEDNTVHVKMPMTGVGARRSSRRHTPFKTKVL